MADEIERLKEELNRLNEEHKQLLAQYDRLQQRLDRGGWILPSEKMPEADSEYDWIPVIATVFESSVMMLKVTCDSCGEREWWDGNPCDGWLYEDSNITAWMPLPEAYKGDKTDEHG